MTRSYMSARDAPGGARMHAQQQANILRSVRMCECLPLRRPRARVRMYISVILIYLCILRLPAFARRGSRLAAFAHLSSAKPPLGALWHGYLIVVGLVVYCVCRSSCCAGRCLQGDTDAAPDGPTDV